MRRFPIILALLTFAAATRPTLADDHMNVRLARIKAAFVLNFARYTTWPDGAFDPGDPDAPLIVTAVGHNAVLNAAMRATFEGKQIGGRSVKLAFTDFPHKPNAVSPLEYKARRESLGRQVQRSHIVFIYRTDVDDMDEILALVDRRPILTISNTSHFTKCGGMLGLVVQGNRVVFDANPKAIRRAKLKLSARVLRLARQVYSKGRSAQ